MNGRLRSLVRVRPRLRPRALHDDERGLVLVFVLLLGVVLFGMLALVIDIGNVQQQRRQAQTGADASALAGAEIIEKYGPGFTGVPGQWSEVVQQVKGYANQNWGVKTSDWVGCSDAHALTYKPDAGAGNGCISADYQVWPTLPPDQSTAPVGSPPQYVNRLRVRLPQRSISTVFGAVLGATSLSTAATSTSAVTRTVTWVKTTTPVTTIATTTSTTTSQVLGGPCALCVLGTGTTLDGQNGDVTITGGGVVVNSTATTAATLNPNGHVKITTTGGTIGGPNAPGNFSGSGFSPTPTQHAAVPDPLVNVPQCGNGGLGDGTTTTVPTECPTNIINTAAKSLPTNLSPGIYNNGIQNSHTLSPGVYVLKGDITLNGNDVLQGNGVMIYMACSNYPSPCAANATGAGIKTTGNGYLKLTAPTTGTYKGMTLFADRNNGATQTFRGNGTNESGPQSGNSGTIYLKGGTLDLRGNGYTLASMIVINKLTMNGNPSAVTISYDLSSNYAVYTTVTTTTTTSQPVTTLVDTWTAAASYDDTGLIS